MRRPVIPTRIALILRAALTAMVEYVCPNVIAAVIVVAPIVVRVSAITAPVGAAAYV